MEDISRFQRGRVVRAAFDGEQHAGLLVRGATLEETNVTVLVLLPDGTFRSTLVTSELCAYVSDLAGVLELFMLVLNEQESYARLPVEALDSDFDIVDFVVHALASGYRGANVREAIARVSDSRRRVALDGLASAFTPEVVAAMHIGRDSLYDEYRRRVSKS